MIARRVPAIIWSVLTPVQRRRFVLLQLVAVLMAVSTVIGLAAVMAFLAVLANPGLIDSHAVLNGLRRSLDLTHRGFLLVMGGGFIAWLILSAITNVVGSLAMGRFACSVGDRVREVLFAGYLQRDYLFHARAGAARLLHNVIYQSDRVTSTLFNGQVLITNAVLTLLVVVSIAVVNPTVALIGVVAIAGSYWFVYRILRRRVARNGRLQSKWGAERAAVVEQAFHGIKYLLVARAQDAFRTRLTTATHSLSQVLADTQFIGQFPKYLLECVAGTALIACAALVSGGSGGGAWLAQLSFIGFAGFRLLPAFQQMYNAFVVVRAHRSAIEDLASQLDDGMPVSPIPKSSPRSGTRGGLRSVELAGVSFRYSPEAPLVLDNVNVRIAAGTAIGIVGASGCGKTTLLDLILGLLVPIEGRIEIDGEALDSRGVMDWQQSIGYVPQEVMILDATVRENVAFGAALGEIDDDRVREAAVQAGASEFIEALPGGYAAKISGMGGALSGGQRQRLGIARALYRQPSLLVLDEATNSLDSETERAVIDAVIRNRGARTLLIVAHGSAVIDACDRVYEMRGGALHDRESTTRWRRAAE